MQRLTLAAAALVALCAFSPSDDEMRVVNAVVDYHADEARQFWAEVQRKNSETMRGPGVRPTRLAVNLLTIAPAASDAVRDKRVYRAYAAARAGERLAWLASRRDLLIVPKEWTPRSDPERFYAKYPKAQGLLALSLPAVSGGEALIYAEFKMVYSEQGRVFYLRKRGGRWVIERVVELFMMPGC